jgi:hypothetical protein
MLTIKATRNLNLSGSYMIDVSTGLWSTAFMRAYLIPHHQAGFDLHKGFLVYNSIAPGSCGPFVRMGNPYFRVQIFSFDDNGEQCVPIKHTGLPIAM